MQPFETIDVEYCDWHEYALLDMGQGKKLERLGDRVIIRSEPKAWGLPTLPQSRWDEAIAIHDEERKRWVFKQKIPNEWYLSLGKLKLAAKFFNTSKHVGVFPEQVSHWKWLDASIKKYSAPKNLHFLSIFGYTGVATLVAAAAGANVTHVDASKPAIQWARTNQELSGLGQAPIRWILDDAKKFVKRELKRGKRYDGIILDPPSFGRGPDGEVWKVETDLVEFLEDCRALLVEKPRCVIMTLYALDASSLMLGSLIKTMMRSHPGTIHIGELAHKQEKGSLVLPLSLYARWSCW